MPEKIVRKTYRSPALKVYGDVRQLTRALTNLASRKDGGPNNTKSF